MKRITLLLLFHFAVMVAGSSIVLSFKEALQFGLITTILVPGMAWVKAALY